MSTDASTAEMAAHEFKAWSGEPDMAAYGQGLNEHATICRMAYLTMYKTKAELIEFARSEPKAFMDLTDAMNESRQAFKEVLAICTAAQARMLCAASAWVEAAE